MAEDGQTGIARWILRNRTRAALGLTFVWLFGFGTFTLLHGLPSKGNEWGDWAAGLFAPVAFFWLVLGYFQQGEELRQNTEALKLQEQELRNQVAETARLAANSERQAVAAEQMVSATLEEKERVEMRTRSEALPIFRPTGGTHSGASVRTTLRNAGATVTQLSTESLEPGVTVRIVPADVFESNAEGKLKIDGALRFPFKFKMSFTDTLGRAHNRTYEVTTPHILKEIPSDAMH